MMGNIDTQEWLGLGLPYEEWTVGRSFRTIARTVTEADITAFVGAVGAVEVLFTNLEYLAEHSVIKGRPAPGSLVFGMSEGLLMQAALQHTGMAFLDCQLTVRAPVCAGDTIYTSCTVVSARRTSKPEMGIVVADNDVINQRGETVISYRATRMIKVEEPDVT